MRILYLSQLIPYPVDAGPKVRIYHVLQHLAAAGHEVTLLAFRRESDDDAAVDHLRMFCTEVHTVPMVRSRARDAYHFGRSLLSGEPFLIARDHVPAMQQRAADLVRATRFDAIHADQLWTAPYALSAVEAAGYQPRLVLDQHNAMYLIPQRLAESTSGAVTGRLWGREAELMRRYEQEICGRFDQIVWVTEEDCAAVGLGNDPDGPESRVIPICVDLDRQPIVERMSTSHRVTFLGGLHWPPNVAGIRWFAREVWPLVRSECPQAVLTVIGKQPPRDLEGLPGAELTGYVPDPTPYLTETAVFIVPLLAGGGMRVKILDAWSWGLPIVSTTIGAEGIRAQHDDNLLLADEPEGFSAAVCRLWRDPEAAARIAAGGRRTVEQFYDWRTIYTAWNDVYPA